MLTPVNNITNPGSHIRIGAQNGDDRLAPVDSRAWNNQLGSHLDDFGKLVRELVERDERRDRAEGMSGYSPGALYGFTERGDPSAMVLEDRVRSGREHEAKVREEQQAREDARNTETKDWITAGADPAAAPAHAAPFLADDFFKQRAADRASDRRRGDARFEQGLAFDRMQRKQDMALEQTPGYRLSTAARRERGDPDPQNASINAYVALGFPEPTARQMAADPTFANVVLQQREAQRTRSGRGGLSNDQVFDLATRGDLDAVKEQYEYDPDEFEARVANRDPRLANQLRRQVARTGAIGDRRAVLDAKAAADTAARKEGSVNAANTVLDTVESFRNQLGGLTDDQLTAALRPQSILDQGARAVGIIGDTGVTRVQDDVSSFRAALEQFTLEQLQYIKGAASNADLDKAGAALKGIREARSGSEFMRQVHNFQRYIGVMKARNQGADEITVDYMFPDFAAQNKLPRTIKIRPPSAGDAESKETEVMFTEETAGTLNSEDFVTIGDDFYVKGPDGTNVKVDDLSAAEQERIAKTRAFEEFIAPTPQRNQRGSGSYKGE